MTVHFDTPAASATCFAVARLRITPPEENRINIPFSDSGEMNACF
jgi:hypothetical protein